MITFSFTVARPSVTVKADGALPSGITVLTGQSGSGKSTFIKCIAGLVKPTTGSIQCDETTWVDRDKKLWVPAQERQVGYMPQGNIVFPHLSVERNITYSKRGTPDMCNTLLQRLGLEKYRHTKAGRLSGGEQQRVALGRALYSKPTVLLLDEPLSALDWNLRKQVREDLVSIILNGMYLAYGLPMMKAKQKAWAIDTGPVKTGLLRLLNDDKHSNHMVLIQ